MIRLSETPFARLTGGVIVVVLLTLPLLARDAEGRRWKNCFWDGGLVRNYERPLDRLPKLQRVPQSGKLPFGPHRLKLDGGGLGGRVRVDEGSFGYTFYNDSYRRKLRLDWVVTAQMRALDPKGHVLRTIDRGHVRIGRVNNANPPGLYLDVLPEVGFYRFDIQFANRGGSRLGAFSDYVRVVESRLDARLGINGRRFRQGGWVSTRVNNVGTASVYYGADFSVQRFEDPDWQPVPEALRGYGWPLYLGILGPGARGRCSGFEISSELGAGRYRIVKEIGLDWSWPTQGPSQRLTAWFDIVE